MPFWLPFIWEDESGSDSLDLSEPPFRLAGELTTLTHVFPLCDVLAPLLYGGSYFLGGFFDPASSSLGEVHGPLFVFPRVYPLSARDDLLGLSVEGTLFNWMSFPLG